jgi:internalin A
MGESYISYKDYKHYCEDAGITDKESYEMLAEFLNDLGVVVHFNNFILDAMHVLDPVWVTNAVYKIITSEKMDGSKGLLHLKHLSEILPPSDSENLPCPPETHPFIMRLMEKFELCYPVGDEVVLIPQLLPVPEAKFDFKQDGSLCFALYYPDFLPTSVFPRFMVKVYKDIEDNLRWRTGVVLEDKQCGVRAVIKADIEARRINIWVNGEYRREYMHYLRYSLADINSSFEKLKVMELVPMPDAQDITADYATLLECAKNSIDKYIPTGSKKVYSVHELLGLVQPKDRDELARVAEKASPQDTITWTELLIELVEPKWTVPVIGITFNLKGF